MTTPATTTTWTTPARAIALENELDLRSGHGNDAPSIVRAICALVDDAIDNAVAQLRAQLAEDLAHKVDIADAVDDGVELEVELENVRRHAHDLVEAHNDLWHRVDTGGLT